MAVVDTGVLIAAFNRRDAYHEQALAIVDAADRGKIGPLTVHDFVLAETLNYMVRKIGSPAAHQALDRLESSDGFRMLRVSDAVFSVAKNETFPRSNTLSFVDALTASLIREHRQPELFSFDRDFDGLPGIRRRTKV